MPKYERDKDSINRHANMDKGEAQEASTLVKELQAAKDSEN